MAASEKIFREAALERLSSPEQLDRLITLTSPIGWTALAALGVMLGAIVAWGFLGSVPTRVQGEGILVTSGGQVFDAMAPAAGSLATVVALGSSVEKGQVVATLDDTQAQEELLHARSVLAEKQQELAQATDRFEREIAARRRVDGQQRENLRNTITVSEQRRTFYETSLQGEQDVAAHGFLTQRFVQETRQRMEDADQEARRARNELLRIDAAELDLTSRRDREISQHQEAVNEARRHVEDLEIHTGRSIHVVSPLSGHVTEVKATPGTVVAPGKAILSIESGGKGLELVLYVPPEQGKKIVPGMRVGIEPATIKKEEYGTLIGSVLAVSDFPVSPEGMTAVLQNAQLVRRFAARGAPYAVRVALLSDAGTPSGYAWSSGAGPPVGLSSGTTASAEVTVRTQAPVSLLLPLLRERTGIGG